MKIIKKNKTGFTLLEIVVVVAIILIISVAFIGNIVGGINGAKSQQSAVVTRDAYKNSLYGSIHTMKRNPPKPISTGNSSSVSVSVWGG